MSKNFLILICGQLREFEYNTESLSSFINDVKVNTEEELSDTVNIHVILQTWDKSYSIFPKNYHSFVEDVTEEKIRQICADKNFDLSNVTIDIAQYNDAVAYIETELGGNYGVDEFSFVTYLAYRSLMTMFKAERELGLVFDSVIKIRPDLYLNKLVGGFGKDPISDKAVYIHNPIQQFTIPENFTIDSQYGDQFEVFGRTAFIAYGQMLLGIKENISTNKLFMHTWPVFHLASFGISCQRLTNVPQERVVIRPLHRIDERFKLHSLWYLNFAKLSRQEILWQADIDKPDSEWTDKFDEHNIVYNTCASDRPLTNGIKHVIFDLDGVLVDSFAANKQSLIDTVNQFGFVFDNAPILNQPIPTIEKLKYLERTQNKPLTDEQRAEFYKTKYLLLAKYFDLIVLNPRAKICIESLLKRGIIVSVASNARHDYVSKIVELIGAQVNPANILGNDSGCKSKPDAAMFLHLAALNKIPAEETLVVDDFKNTILTAAEHGFKTFRVKKFEDVERLYK